VNIVIVSKPLATDHGVIYDYLQVLPVSRDMDDIFSIEGTNILFVPYVGARGRTGIKIYKPLRFEGKLIGHSIVTVRPNGAINRTSDTTKAFLAHCR
jgi:hypothetical protein